MSVKCEVHFDQKLRKWDGFGVNYVAAAQARIITSGRRIMARLVYLMKMLVKRLLNLFW